MKLNLNFGLASFVLSVFALVISVVSIFFSSVSDKKIESYVEKNPKKILDSITNMLQEQRKQESEESEKKAKDYIKSNKQEILSRAIPLFSGDFKLSVVMFSDYSCGYCKTSASYIDDLSKKFPNVSFSVIEFPILGRASDLAARVAIYTYKQNPSKYKEVHDKLIQEKSLTEDKIIKIAASALGISESTVKSESESKDILEAISKNQSTAMQLGSQGTPMFIIGDFFSAGFVKKEEMESIITKELSAVANTSATTATK